jgi:dipeptidyl aminopeptidase/acylaminoacyl peptidase
MTKAVKSVILFILFVSFAFPQSDVLTSYNIFNLKFVVETSVSPDGRHVAYTVLVPRPFTNDPGTDYRHLYVLNLSDKTSKGLIVQNSIIQSIGWMPDSRTITFRTRLGDAKVVQVYSIDAEGGEPMAITKAENTVSQYEVHPDGSKLAYVSTESHPLQRQELRKKGFDAEIYEEEYLDLNLYIQDLKTNEAKKLTSGFTVFDFKWSPDGSRIVAAIADKNLVDYSYMFKRIYLVDPENGTRTLLVENPGKLTDIVMSPDGRHIAFVAGVDVHDPVSGSLFLAEVPNTKSFDELKNYSVGFEGSVKNIRWKDNTTILFSAEEGVDITLSEQDINSNERKLLINHGQIVFSNFSYSSGVVSFGGNSPRHPSELFTFNLSNSNFEKHTNLNSWLADMKLGKQEKIEYEARDGLRIEGVLIYPVDFEEGKRYPLIVYAHGGPEAAEQNGWNTSYGKWGQIAAGKGYFVFHPNYRASSGRGVEFAKMDFGDLGAAEFDDVIDGIDYLIDKGYVDKDKVGIGGGSYGGYFAGWGATKHTERFAAAVSFVGVSNQISKRNTTDIPYEDYYVHWGFWTHENYELVYDRSPVKYAHQSKTPTLILHGKEDPRVHPSQSLELYRSLKTHGQAPVRLIWYPGQGHGNSKNTSRLDYSLRTMEWFDYYLMSDKPKDQMPGKWLNPEEVEAF